MAQNVTGSLANGGRRPTNAGRSDAFALPGIDQNKLKARIYAKSQLAPNPNALKFTGRTPVQEKKVRSVLLYNLAHSHIHIQINFMSISRYISIVIHHLLVFQ